VGSVLAAEVPLAVSFGTGSIGYGLIATTFGVGALAGSLAGRALTESNERRLLVTCSFVTAAGLGAVALAPAFWVVLLAMLVSGGSDGLVDVAVEVIYQRLSPDAVRSRVLAGLETVFQLGLAVSFLFSGTLIDGLGPRAAYALAGVGCAVAACMLVPLLSSRASTRTLE
jgi:predicted MFS family arabinose efflux permease